MSFSCCGSDHFERASFWWRCGFRRWHLVGFTESGSLEALAQSDLDEKKLSERLMSRLVHLFLRKVEMRGSDVRLDSSTVFKAGALPKAFIDPTKWVWKEGRAFHWRRSEHINCLEEVGQEGTRTRTLVVLKMNVKPPLETLSIPLRWLSFLAAFCMPGLLAGWESQFLMQMRLPALIENLEALAQDDLDEKKLNERLMGRLVHLFLRKVEMRGSDVRPDSSTVFKAGALPKAFIDRTKWVWKEGRAFHWRRSEHINCLEEVGQEVVQEHGPWSCWRWTSSHPWKLFPYLYGGSPSWQHFVCQGFSTALPRSWLACGRVSCGHCCGSDHFGRASFWWRWGFQHWGR